jgi:uncharacterized protein (UPF0332 family)
LTKQGKQAVVPQECALAEEELGAAEKLVAAGFGRVALTRAYYAVFHALRALLYVNDLEPRSHHGALHLFRAHLVGSGQYPAATALEIAELQRHREDADYESSFVIDPSTAGAKVASARMIAERLLADARQKLASLP